MRIVAGTTAAFGMAAAVFAVGVVVSPLVLEQLDRVRDTTNRELSRNPVSKEPGDEAEGLKPVRHLDATDAAEDGDQASSMWANTATSQ